ncbi:MAG: MBL fold metallo-hydrolase [Planctomycetes bacterium]|nr:MBL fold metallo-hydrolase [Planctomycetota bacterium]
MNLTTLGHAAALVTLKSGSKLVLDPWLEDPAYFNSWWHFPPLAKKLPDLGKIDGVYLSHDHPDHCDPKTLAKLPKATEILIPAYTTDSLDRILGELGFVNIRRMAIREPFAWHGALLECFRTDLPWDDSALMVRDDETTLFDMNDCKLFDTTLDTIGKNYNIDVALIPYSGAIQFPTCYELASDEKLRLCAERRAGHLKYFVDRAARLRPRIAVPFAAGYCLPSTEQWWMNDINNINSPAQARAALEAASPRSHGGAAIQCLDMNPGDTWSAAAGLLRSMPAPDWSRHFEIVREHARELQTEVRAARAAETDSEPGLADRFFARFRTLLQERADLAKAANYKVIFDVRGAHGFVAYVDTTRIPAETGLGEIPDWNLKIRIPSIMLDAVLDGRVTWDEVLISFRLWFEERPPVYHEPWWALLHSTNRLDPKRYISNLNAGAAPR